jgi:site-specific DNA-cytosine methylase
MNVLSLFDGMSCGQIALERAGIPVTNYYASEIDKYAIKVTQANYPETKQLGSIETQAEWELPQIDLIMGGSPCQGFSFAGKQLNFDDPRSKLFFDFVEALHRFKPKYFLLENVKMKKEYQDVITRMLGGIEPIEINSARVSGQNRERFYWANIPGITQPEDKGIMLKDVVFKDATNPTVCMHNLYGGFGEKEHRTFTEKSPTLRTAAGGGHIPSLLLSEKALDYMDRKVKGGRSHWDFKHHSDINEPKSAAIVANFFKGVPYNVLKDESCIRHFDPVECERLQTIDDNYSNHVSKTQRLKMLGNGWTVDVIAHIFRAMKKDIIKQTNDIELLRKMLMEVA